MSFKSDTQAANPVVIRYQVYKDDGETLVTQADVSTITVYVFDTSTEVDQTSGGVSANVATTIFNTPQIWDNDNIGYNFKLKVSKDYIGTGGTTYRVEALVTPTAGEPYYLKHVELRAEETYSG